MKKLKSLESNLVKVIISSLVIGFVIAVVLAHVALAGYIVTCNRPTEIEVYLDTEPNQSIRKGF